MSRRRYERVEENKSHDWKTLLLIILIIIFALLLYFTYKYYISGNYIDLNDSSLIF